MIKNHFYEKFSDIYPISPNADIKSFSGLFRMTADYQVKRSMHVIDLPSVIGLSAYELLLRQYFHGEHEHIINNHTVHYSKVSEVIFLNEGFLGVSFHANLAQQVGITK